MQIPVGLMSPTAQRDQRTDGNANQGYWQGDRYVYPKRRYAPPPPSLMSPDLGKAIQTVQETAQKAQEMANAAPYGDGPQGEGFSGGREGMAPGQSPGMSEAGHVNAPDMNANVQGMMGQQNPAGLPSLPSFQEQAPAPTAPTAPTNQDLAVSEVDPQGPSGVTGKGMSATQAANQAATQAANANTTAAVAAVDKAVQEKGLTGLAEAVAAAMGATGVNAVGVDAETAAGGLGAKSDRQEGLPSVSQAFADHASVTGKGSTSSGGNSTGGLGGADGVGGPGAGGMGSPGGIGGGGSSAPGGSSDQGPGSWRAGGRTGNDGDKRKLEPRGTAHEDEFYLNPEMTSLMDSRAPGLLDALDRMQKGLMDRPRKPARGLMSR